MEKIINGTKYVYQNSKAFGTKILSYENLDNKWVNSGEWNIGKDSINGQCDFENVCYELNSRLS